MNAFTVLGEIGFVLLWCNPRVCPEVIPTMAAWSDDGRLVKPMTADKGGSNGYMANETVLTFSKRSVVIAEYVVIHEQFRPEFLGQKDYCKLLTWKMLWRIFRCMANLFPAVFSENRIFRV